MPLTIDDFTMVPESQFGLAHLHLHPVWARYYEPDDIDIACSWGVDRGVFTRLLRDFHDGSNHAFFPCLSLDPLPDDELDLYIRASFATATGTEFDGCVSADAHYIQIYADDVHSYSFNSNPGLADLRDKELKRLQGLIPDASLFPLRYTTSFKLADGSELSGDFNPLTEPH